jgi:hypothetical protein
MGWFSVGLKAALECWRLICTHQILRLLTRANHKHLKVYRLILESPRSRTPPPSYMAPLSLHQHHASHRRLALFIKYRSTAQINTLVTQVNITPSPHCNLTEKGC